MSNTGVAAQTGQQVLNAGSGAAASATGLNQIGLVDMLVHKLGVSPQQALGGAGAIFQAAKGNMNPQAFASLSQSVPGMSTMLGAAPSVSGASGLGGMSSMEVVHWAVRLDWPDLSSNSICPQTWLGNLFPS